SGADHISAHRTFALMMGPYVKKGALIKQRYSQVSIVKTIEAIFDLPPMSQWDANAKAIINGFTSKQDNGRPYKFLKITVKKRLNPGICSQVQKLRLKLGAKLPKKYVPVNFSGNNPVVKISRKNLYTPTTLLKVDGYQQFKQEWLGVKGIKSFHKVVAYIKTLAEKEKAPVAHFIGLGK
ncbi:MAG: alkaline phosphatase family protein, partial [Deltaproteobacteria bacterium]|nr:alkaline phosphatase family protein [Deltaproteobacteria bacterium]